MDDQKPATKSITIISNALSIAALAAGAFIPSVTPEVQAGAVQGGSMAVAGVLQLFSIWGRLRATKRIS